MLDAAAVVRMGQAPNPEARLHARRGRLHAARRQRTLPSGGNRGRHCRQSAVRSGRLPQRPRHPAVHKPPLRQVFRDRGCPEGVSGVRAVGRWCPPVLRRLAGLTSAGERTALLACWPDYGSRRGDGRSVRRLSAVAGLSAALSTAGCGGVRRADRTATAVLGAHDAGGTAGGVRRRWPPRTPPQPAGVRGYRKWSPGRRPLVGCSHRHHARRTCRASRWRSCSRTYVMAGRSRPGPPRRSARRAAGP